MRTYSARELEEITQRYIDDERTKRNMICLIYTFVGFMAAIAVGCIAYLTGWLS